jgi:hypothetical protein
VCWLWKGWGRKGRVPEWELEGIPRNVEMRGPLFFVSVASKGLSQSVSLLFAILTGRSTSVASKGLKAKVGK